MFGVEDDLAAVLLHFIQRDAVRDHREVLFERRLQHVRDVQRPRLAHERHGRRLRVEERLQVRVVLGLHVTPAAVLPNAVTRACWSRLGQDAPEELRILRVATPASRPRSTSPRTDRGDVRS